MALYILAIVLIIINFIEIGIGIYIMGGDIIREHKIKKLYRKEK